MSESKSNVPKLRFPGFTGPWEQRKLGEIASLHARIGWQNLRTSEFLTSGDYLLVTGTDFENGLINFSGCCFVEKERYEQDRNIQIHNGSILITKDGTLGKVAFVQDLRTPATLNAGIFNIVVRNRKRIDAFFLYQYLRAPWLMEFANRGATGGTIKHLNQSLLIKFPIMFPDLEEQRAIGALFRDVDDLITLHQRKLDDVKQLKRGLLQKMFPKDGADVPELRFPGFTDPWEQRKLGDFGHVSMCKRIYKDQTRASGDIPFFKIGTFGSAPDAFISKELYEQYRTQYPYPKPGTLLISAAGSIGRIVEYKGEQAYYQDSNIVWLEHDGRLDDSFLKQFLSVTHWRLEGSTVKRLYNKDILTKVIILPDLVEQRLIGALFCDVDDLITLHQRELDHVKLLKKALLQQMFV